MPFGRCESYCSDTGCDWTQKWLCPWQPGDRKAADDGSVGFECCCVRRQSEREACGGGSVATSTTTTDIGSEEGGSTDGGKLFPPLAKVHGVNYGARFLPEEFFKLPRNDELYNGVHADGGHLSLCDVGAKSNAGSRMSAFLDRNIRQEHFKQMAQLRFDTVRLPLGYWNLIDLPSGEAPDGPPDVQARWRRLQGILPARSYRKWIDQVFRYAKDFGLQVMLELHGAPGAQAGNAFSGCDLGGDHVYHFDRPRNRELGIKAITRTFE